MPVNPTYPGVYIQEIPSGARSITGVATSVAAFIGSFSRGPIDTAIRLFSVGDFDTHFGGVDVNSETSYSLAQFYTNGGGEAWVVRVGGGTNGSLSMQSWNGVTSMTVSAGRMVRGTTVQDPGHWNNNIRIDIDYQTQDPTIQFNMTINEIRTEDGRELPVRSEVYRNLSMTTTDTRYVIDVVNEASQMVQVTAVVGGTDLPAASGYYSGPQVVANYVGIDANNILDIDLGTGVVSVTVDVPTPPTTMVEAAAILQQAMRDTLPADPLWAQSQVLVRGDRLVILAGRASTDYDPGHVITVAETAGDFATTLELLGNAEANVQQYSMNTIAPAGFLSAATAGTDGAAPNAATLRGNRAARTGIYALEDVETFNVLAIPEASSLGSTANLSSVMSAAITYCEERRVFVLIDPPPGTDTLDDALGWVEEIGNAGLRHRNAAAYYSRVRIPDMRNEGRLRSSAPSGTIAGLYARNDTRAGVWTAAAGVTANLRNVLDFDHGLTDQEIGQLNPIGLNCLRNAGIPGNIAWGARTLVGADVLASDWKYIPVRRMALFIEETLFRGLQWAVFKPNDEPLWAEIRIAVTNFMQGLFRQGAFQGSAPNEAFRVKCDAETTTQADIDAGIINVLVGFAPLKPAEFVVVSLQLQNNQPSS